MESDGKHDMNIFSMLAVFIFQLCLVIAGALVCIGFIVVGYKSMQESRQALDDNIEKFKRLPLSSIALMGLGGSGILILVFVIISYLTAAYN